MNVKGYRLCVIGVFLDKEGNVLVGERSDLPGSWQLPQGGVEQDESIQDAFRREMWEELGTKKFRITDALDTPICYDFPEELTHPLTKRYCGQEQHWLVATFEEGAKPDLSVAPDQEFSAFDWVTPQVALERVVSFKRAAYEAAFRKLRLI